MSIAIQRHRCSTVRLTTYTGPAGEITVDTDKWVAVVHDGLTAGGVPLAKENHTHAIATESTPGFMSAPDKIKLDTIIGGSISYQTIQSNGFAQPQEEIVNYTSNFAITDDAAGNRTSVDLADSGVGSGTYTKVTVNSKGRVTAATLLGSGDIPNLTSSKITDFTASVLTHSLDAMAAPLSDVSMNNHKVINMADPVSSTDAATKQYVDTTATGLTFKPAVRVASAGANINILAPGTSIDTVSLSSGDRVLLKDQSDGTQNGIYNWNGASSTMTRTSDANTDNQVRSGMFVLVTAGSVNAGVGFVLSTQNPITLGTTSLTFVAFSSGSGSVTAGNGINVNGSIVSVNSANSGRIAVSSSGIDLASISGLTPGTYQQFTVDAYGRITATTGATWQPYNAGLTTIAGLGINGFVSRTALNTFAARTIQPGTGIQITNGDGSSGNVSISVTPNTTKQQLSVLSSGALIGTRANLNIIPGTGASFTIADNNSYDRVDLTIGLTPGGGAAPSTSQYVTLATDTNLSNERVLVAGTGLNLADGGSGNNVTISLITDFGSVP
jgi:hypothetical protein